MHDGPKDTIKKIVTSWLITFKFIDMLLIFLKDKIFLFLILYCIINIQSH